MHNNIMLSFDSVGPL